MIWTHVPLKANGSWKNQPVRSAQPKYDGIRLMLFAQSDGSVLGFGRDHRPHLEYLSRFPRLHELLPNTLASLRKIPFSSVDGELYVPGQPASAVATALRDKSIPLKYQPFAIPFWNNCSLENALISRVGEAINHYLDVPVESGFEVSELYTEPGFLDMLKKQAKDQGYEGWVLKQSNYKNWFKIKESYTVDAIITGVKEGDGKYLCMVGALIVSVYTPTGELKVIANASGMTDFQREQMTDDHDNNKLIGRVVEIEYQYTGARGKLRHPRFKRFRPDKPASECLLNQLEA